MDTVFRYELEGASVVERGVFVDNLQITIAMVSTRDGALLRGAVVVADYGEGTLMVAKVGPG